MGRGHRPHSTWVAGGGRVKRAATACATFVGAGALAFAVATHAVGDDGAATACATPPAPVVGPADDVPRDATLVYDATYLHMEVEGLDAWVQDVAAGEGRRYADFVDACPAALADERAVAAGVPAGARGALAAARRYSREMWGETQMTRLLPAVVRASRVAGSRTWTFALVGPRSQDWRYVVVDADDEVVAWQLKGSDAQRLFGTEPGAAS